MLNSIYLLHKVLAFGQLDDQIHKNVKTLVEGFPGPCPPGGVSPPVPHLVPHSSSSCPHSGGEAGGPHQDVEQARAVGRFDLDSLGLEELPAEE